MTSNSDPGGQLELKFCMHASVMGHYECTNFHQNRRGSGTEVCDLTWNDPFINIFWLVHSTELIISMLTNY